MLEELGKALKQWAKIAGADPDFDGGSLADWQVNSTVEELNEANALDQSGLTTAMLLNAVYTKWAENATVNLKQLVDKDPDVMKLMREYKLLNKRLRAGPIREAVDDFRESTFEMLGAKRNR